MTMTEEEEEGEESGWEEKKCAPEPEVKKRKYCF